MNISQSRFSDLSGASVLITGGASGIGSALVKGFARQGARVGFFDIDSEAAEETSARIVNAGLDRPEFIKVDLRDIDTLKVAVPDMAGRLGGIKVLVNNAGWDDRHAVVDVTESYWDRNQAINVKPVFFMSQAAYPFLKAAGGGAIVNFSSIAYLMNLPNMPAYLTAKAGIIGLTKGLAGEFGSDGIRVNAILPGMVLTERQKALWITEEAEAEHRSRQCLDFTLTAEHMVGPCLFLASDCSAAITAQMLVVDGGFL